MTERRDPLSVRPKLVEKKTSDAMANEGESDDEEVEGTVGDEEIETKQNSEGGRSGEKDSGPDATD